MFQSTEQRIALSPMWEKRESQTSRNGIGKSIYTLPRKLCTFDSGLYGLPCCFCTIVFTSFCLLFDVILKLLQSLFSIDGRKFSWITDFFPCFGSRMNSRSILTDNFKSTQKEVESRHYFSWALPNDFFNKKNCSGTDQSERIESIITLCVVPYTENRTRWWKPANFTNPAPFFLVIINWIKADDMHHYGDENNTERYEDSSQEIQRWK